MTLRSRRKHRITAPTIRRATKGTELPGPARASGRRRLRERASRWLRPLLGGVALFGAAFFADVLSAPVGAEENPHVAFSAPQRATTSNGLRQPGAATGWQRRGAGGATNSSGSTSMPRPFDAPADAPAVAAVQAPWAEPTSNDGATQPAPEPPAAAARIRHVSGSVQSPGKPLAWRVKMSDGAPTSISSSTAGRPSSGAAVRPTAHLQDAVEDSAGTQFNSPQTESAAPLTAQGRAVPALDPAVPPPPPPPTETDAIEKDPAPADEAPKTPETPRPRFTPRTNPLAPAAPGDAPELAPIPEGAPRAGGPRRREPDLNLLRDVPCERMYGPDKNRNCCAEELLCGEARKRVKQLTIRKINLDITPTCNLAGEWSDAPETKCGWQLELSPPRAWKNRTGETIARGRFSGFEHARVVITDEAGEETRLRFRDLSEDDRCFVTAWCGLPFECGLVEEPLLARNWAPVTMTWKASGLCHKPLYFEDAQLERYGHTYGPIVQPVVSGAHFFTNIALLPYNMGIHPMTECQYSLGYYRPGACAPRIIPPFPLSVRGALWEAGVWVGGIYLIP